MAAIGRFGKYGDLKRKEKIRTVKLSSAGVAKASFKLAKAGQEDRLGKGYKKK
ncbi:MAG: hypothetical protein AB9866_10715 [Syntrophobacteraceae bacterium]